MKALGNNKHLFILAGTVLLLASMTLSGCKGKKPVSNTESMLCVGDYWTEAQGKAFLDEQKKTYTTAEAWEKRAGQIRSQILKGSGLEKFPDKCPLNALIGEKRVYDGYQVQNVAFESLPGVFVTGSLYTPNEVKGQLAGILSPHGHWTDTADYGRYRPDSQKRFAEMARMGAMVLGYDMVGFGQMAEFGWIHEHPQVLSHHRQQKIRLRPENTDSAIRCCTAHRGCSHLASLSIAESDY